MRVVIKHTSDARNGRVQAFSADYYRSLLIGRGSLCEVDFSEDRLVSRTHAVIEWADDTENSLQLRDLESTNGTFVNGKRVTHATRLHSGDRIRIGTRGPEMEVKVMKALETTEPEPSTVYVPMITTDSGTWPVGVSY